MADTPIRCAVVGAGAFGTNHARVLAAAENAELVAVVDTDQTVARRVAGEHSCRAETAWQSLSGQVDAVCLATPTSVHAEVGCALLEAGIDVLVEKPIAATVAEADLLIASAAQHGRVLQIGHLEQFNPIVEAAQAEATLPLFFEVDRLGSFSMRSLDVDVILDLMIHDLDIVLSMVPSEIDRLEATGIAVLSSKPDIGSVRLVFENGCVANLAASRISVEKIRKLRFFQPAKYVSIDYAAQSGHIHEINSFGLPSKRALEAQPGEPLAREIGHFLDCVRTRKQPLVTGLRARKALGLALRIVEEMAKHASVVKETLDEHARHSKST